MWFETFQSSYAFSPQDTDFTSYPSSIGRQHPQQSQRYYNNNCGLGSVGNMANSTNSLNSGTNNSGTNLIVNYLPQDMQDRELYSLFRTIGPINTCRIMRDYKVWESKNIYCSKISILTTFIFRLVTVMGMVLWISHLKLMLCEPLIILMESQSETKG